MATAVLALGVGCSGDASPPATSPGRSGAPTSGTTRTTSAPAAPVRFHATLLQYRPDEGTNRLEVELTNQGTGTVTVRAVRIEWPGLRGAPTTPTATAYVPGQTIDLTTTYGAAVCGGPPSTTQPRAWVRLAGGAPVTVQLDRHGSDMLRRFWARDCALQRVAAAASVHLGRSFHSVHIGGQEYLRGSLLLRRPTADASTPVTVTTLTGSVLLRFVAPPDAPLPVTLAAGGPALAVPVLIGSTFRCDDHGRSQSTQTYLLSAYVRLGDDRDQHRVIVVPDAGVRAQAQSLMNRACR